MRIALTAAALAGTWLAAAEPRFALEQVMALRSPRSDGGPKGGRIAWVFNTRGRNIWLAERPVSRRGA
jgi:hypothetical protein